MTNPSDDKNNKLIPKAFLNSPGFLLSMAAKLLTERVVTTLEPTGLTVQQYGLMRIIDAEGPITQNEFAAKYSVDRTTVTEIVDGLEERGLVTRQRSKTDRRCNQLFLTPSGKKLLTRTIKMVQKTNKEFLSVMSETEWETLRDSLMKLIAGSSKTT